MANENILVVDDEEDILELVRYNLMREGYGVLCAATGEAAVRIAGEALPDLIVLDLMLPGVDGLEVTRIIKGAQKTASIPIVMLTAKGEEADIVTGLEMGADDYVSKPFSPRVLSARIKAVLRRFHDKQALVDQDAEIRIGDLLVRPGMHLVKVCDENVTLTFSEFELLLLLCRRPGWVFTRTQIVDSIRGINYAVTDRSVDVQVVGLRKKLGVCGKYIETVRGIGYRFRELDGENE